MTQMFLKSQLERFTEFLWNKASKCLKEIKYFHSQFLLTVILTLFRDES